MSALVLEHVDIAYSGVPVVHDVSFAVAEGESFALVGESGSGKSTVLKAIGGLATEWTGQISVLGQPRAHGTDLAFARACQMVFQDPYGSLHPRKTVNTTLIEPLAVHRLGDRDRRVAATLQAVGLDARFRFRFPHQLSGGQRQRVAIARALMLEPKVMLLDEPTSALDVSVQAEILNLLKRLRREQGLTYLMVTHNLPVVSFLCDRLAVMKAGRIVEIAEARTLHTGAFAHPYSRELYAASGGARGNRGTGMTDFSRALADFDHALGEAAKPDDAFDALHELTRATVGVRLFTIMTVDMDQMLARRVYTSDPENYPCSGTKPVEMNSWFEVVHTRREMFVANTLAEIAKVFPDHELIGSLGCGSVVNLPIVLGGQLVATMNVLDREHHYSSERVSADRVAWSPCQPRRRFWHSKGSGSLKALDLQSSSKDRRWVEVRAGTRDPSLA